MSGRRAAWRPALRMAARDICRHRARSLLVVLLVGLPVLLSSVAATLIATQDESVAESLPARLGQAQAAVTPYGERVAQNADGDMVTYDGEGARQTYDTIRSELADLTGATLLPVQRGYARLVIGARGWQISALRGDLTSPLTEGMSVLDSGRHARAADEVVVTPAIAADGAGIGDTVVVDGASLTVVGIGTVDSVGSDRRRRAVAIPEDSIVPASTTGDLSVLVDRRKPVAWDEVKRLNARGFVVVSRSVVLDPPPANQIDQSLSSVDHRNEQLVAIVVTALVIEVVLLAGPAFAVSARRQRRELATVAAAGGAPRDLRRIVLAQALVLGAGACLVAALASVPASWIAARLAGTGALRRGGPLRRPVGRHRSRGTVGPRCLVARRLGAGASGRPRRCHRIVGGPRPRAASPLRGGRSSARC